MYLHPLHSLRGPTRSIPTTHNRIKGDIMSLNLMTKIQLCIFNTKGLFTLAYCITDCVLSNHNSFPLDFILHTYLTPHFVGNRNWTHFMWALINPMVIAQMSYLTVFDIIHDSVSHHGE